MPTKTATKTKAKSKTAAKARPAKKAVKATKPRAASAKSGKPSVRVLVGTRKGAFILTSDAKRKNWNVSGPHFAGWEIYHVNGSPADPDRLYASQSTGWFGQLIQRSNDGGQTWAPVDNKFV